MSEKTIVVLGITGTQGASVTNTFLSLPGWKVRGITRSTTKPRALAWISKGVSLAQADLNNLSTLQAAFKNAAVIFANTDFCPVTQTLLKPGQSLPEYCYEQEVQQMKNIAAAAAQVEGLERFVLSSLVDVAKWSGGKYKGVYHFDSKARATEFIKEEYPGLAGKTTTLIVGSYMENWKDLVKLTKSADGAYRLALPGSGLRPIHMIDVESDLGNIFHAAIHVEPGKNIAAASAMLSWTDMLKIWCEINKVAYGGFDSVSIEVFASFVPVPDLGLEFGEMSAFIDDFGYDGSDPSIVSTDDLGVFCPLTSFEEFVKRQDWTSMLSS